MANLDAVYEAELKAAGDNAKEKLRIDEAYEKAKLALKKRYNQLGGEDDKNALQQWNQDVLDWLEGDGGQPSPRASRHSPRACHPSSAKSQASYRARWRWRQPQ